MVLGLIAVAPIACSGDDPETTTTTLRSTSSTAESFSGDADSPFCSLLANLDPTELLTGDSKDPTAVQKAFEGLVGVLREAQALAPAEIEQDLALVRAGIEALDSAVKAVGYDLEALAQSGRSSLVTQALGDPVFKAAGERLGTYRTQVCHL